MTTTQAALSAWRSYGTPDATTDDAAKRRLRFAFLASMYDGTAYSGDVGRRYREAGGLYAHTRPVVNHVKRLCDFYATHLYAGPISPDGDLTFQGHDAAVPLLPLIGGVGLEGGDGAASEAAAKRLRVAFGQLYQWWGWAATLEHRVRQTAILGTTLTELVDEPGAGKVMPSLVWPGFVEEITLDAASNVKGYAIEYAVHEDGPLDRATGKRTGKPGDRYRFRKVVDGEGFYYYRDDKLVREVENAYGFVPAVWDRHGLGWGVWGEPAIAGSQAATDEINELLSHATDRLHAHFASPLVVSGYQSSTKLDLPGTTRGEVGLFGVPPGGDVKAVDLDIGQVAVALDRIDAAVGVQCPEIKLYDLIRGMSDVTAPGIRRATGDIEKLVNSVAGIFDPQTVKLLQMATAIAGWRLAIGDWGRAPTEQQRKFAPFGMNSYKSGQMDCVILPRELARPTLLELATEQEAVERLRDRASLLALGMAEAEADERLAARTAAEAARDARLFAVGGEGTGAI